MCISEYSIRKRCDVWPSRRKYNKFILSLVGIFLWKKGFVELRNRKKFFIRAQSRNLFVLVLHVFPEPFLGLRWYLKFMMISDSATKPKKPFFSWIQTRNHYFLERSWARIYPCTVFSCKFSHLYSKELNHLHTTFELLATGKFHFLSVEVSECSLCKLCFCSLLSITEEVCFLRNFRLSPNEKQNWENSYLNVSYTVRNIFTWVIFSLYIPSWIQFQAWKRFKFSITFIESEEIF